MKTTHSILFLIFLTLSNFVLAQSNPQALDTDITVQRIMTVQNGVIRLAKDPVTNHLFYVQTGGNIYQVVQPSVGAAYDSLVDSTVHHSVQYVQGFAFYDSTMYVSGNNHSDSSMTAGIIARGKLLQNGTRKWDTLMITDYYQTADYFDHLFSGLVVNPAGDTIYVCSGARGDHGEVQTRYGAYPGLRNVPLTTNIYALPTHNSGAIILPNDSLLLAASGYLFCGGVRNHFDMAFDSFGNLFGLENSGDRDHNEEMNWLRRNHHYGFPWRMGDTDNPQQFTPFDPSTDKLINHFSRSWRLGFFGNDSLFPPPPPGLIVDAPIQNFGPDCDKYRDTSGAVLDASDSSISIGTFTAHRSPLGLVFDNAHVLSSLYNGDGFMLSWTKGYDSSGCSTPPDTSIGPFVDPSQDLVHLDLSFDSIAGNFSLHATRIVSEFDHPVDAEIDGNKIYVVENGYGGTSGLYEVTLPLASLPCHPTLTLNIPDPCKPDSNIISVPSFGTIPNDYYWYNSSGSLVRSDTGLTSSDSISYLPSDIYYVVINDSGVCGIDTLLFTIPDSLGLHIDSITHTHCIGCNDGSVYFTISGGLPPYLVQINGNVVTGNNAANLAADTFLICVTDFNGCVSCDQVIILDDPTKIQLLNHSEELTIFPNPVKNIVTLHFNSEDMTSISLIDLSGKVVRSYSKDSIKTNSNELKISCADLSPGVYTLTFTGKISKSFKKIIIVN